MCASILLHSLAICLNIYLWSSTSRHMNKKYVFRLHAFGVRAEKTEMLSFFDGIHKQEESQSKARSEIWNCALVRLPSNSSTNGVFLCRSTNVMYKCGSVALSVIRYIFRSIAQFILRTAQLDSLQRKLATNTNRSTNATHESYKANQSTCFSSAMNELERCEYYRWRQNHAIVADSKQQ